MSENTDLLGLGVIVRFTDGDHRLVFDNIAMLLLEGRYGSIQAIVETLQKSVRGEGTGIMTVLTDMLGLIYRKPDDEPRRRPEMAPLVDPRETMNYVNAIVRGLTEGLGAKSGEAEAATETAAATQTSSRGVVSITSASSPSASTHNASGA